MTPAVASTQTPSRRAWWVVGLMAALVAGAALRLLWAEDMEYKREEAWTFERTQRVGRAEPFPWVGMPNSVQVPHPGLSLWVFLGLERLFPAREPTDLARAVQLLNVAALGLLVLFAFRVVPRGEREPWLWAAALLAVNPLAVLFHRKIWPPSVLPVFTLLVLLGWWYRPRRWGAALWGLAGALIGQVNPAGFFLAAGFAAWALLFDRRRVAWRWWLAGSAVGALALVPWLASVGAAAWQRPGEARRWTHVVEGKFWARWATEPFGVSLQYALGQDFPDFLASPHLAGRPTYLVGLLHAVLAAVALAILARAGRHLWRQRRRWADLLIGRGSATAFTQSAALWGFGLLFTASGLPVHRHYMVILFPLAFLWVARLALGGEGAPAPRLGRPLLLTLCLAQLLISAGFLGYVHANPRPLRGDYGLPYRAQVDPRAVACDP
ncbi:MAG TPA: hypothetical protein VFA26_22475 [Gemmataceae bacterium]|nr:hypothetical protein [Gemmataceae bacterium]